MRSKLSFLRFTRFANAHYDPDSRFYRQKPTHVIAPVHPDLLGYAIHRYHFMGDTSPINIWINGRRDADMQPSVFFRNYSHMQGWERRAMQLTRGSVLDVGAGAGCHSLLLQRRGLDVTALDQSPLACDVMHDRGVHRILQENISDVRGISFDTILFMMNGLGMSGTSSQTIKMLSHCRKLLGKKGQILGDSTDILYSRMNSLEAFGQDHYYGEVEFEIEYHGMRAAPFRWLYLDPALLAELADKAGLEVNIEYRDSDFHYLARMTAG